MLEQTSPERIVPLMTVEFCSTNKDIAIVSSATQADWFYSVTLNPNRCDCPDFQKRSKRNPSHECKHIKEAKKQSNKVTCQHCGKTDYEKPGYTTLARYKDEYTDIGYYAHPACESQK